MRPPYTKFRIEGLSCLGGGSASLERVLGRLPGITEVYVNPATAIAYLRHDPSVLKVGTILETIEHSGYRARELRAGERAAEMDSAAGR